MTRILVLLLFVPMLCSAADRDQVDHWQLAANRLITGYAVLGYTTNYQGMLTDANSDFAYGIHNVSQRTLKIGSNLSSNYFGTALYGWGGYTVQEIFATSDTNRIIAIARDAYKGYLGVSTNGGTNFDLTLNLGHDDSLGHITNVWAMQRGFAEVTIGGTLTYLVGEYNVNATRTAGGACDKVRLMKSEDLGLTWTKLVEWNTAGANIIRHIHAVRVDPFRPHMVYICTGDTDDKSMICQWDTTLGTWADNLTPAQLATRTGFRCAYGDQTCRTVDLLFTVNFIHYASDSGTGDGAALPGLYRRNKTLSIVQNQSSVIGETDYNYGWSGAVIGPRSVLLTTQLATDATSRLIRIWTSPNEGETWGVAATFSTTNGVPTYLRTASFGTNAVLGSYYTAGSVDADARRTSFVHFTGAATEAGTPLELP